MFVCARNLLAEQNAGGRPSIHQESAESSQTRILQLESENKHLNAVNNAYKESVRTLDTTQVVTLGGVRFLTLWFQWNDLSEKFKNCETRKLRGFVCYFF